ncbi:hypothetical protein PMAYCL1PPCAC_16822, partial [Pristionchus mayeri]
FNFHWERDFSLDLITVMVAEATVCWLVRVYPLVPYPALYCDGLLCRLGLPQQVVMTFIIATILLPNPPFWFLLVNMHQNMIAITDSRVRLSKRAQKLMMITLIVMHVLNLAGIFTF